MLSVQVAFSMTVLDVEKTLRHSCDLVLRDEEPTDAAARQRRGEALAALGKLFMEVADGTDRETRHADAFDTIAEQMQAAIVAEQHLRAQEEGGAAVAEGEGGGDVEEGLVPPAARP